MATAGLLTLSWLWNALHQNHYAWDKLQTKEIMGEKEVDYFLFTQTKNFKKIIDIVFSKH